MVHGVPTHVNEVAVCFVAAFYLNFIVVVRAACKLGQFIYQGGVARIFQRGVGSPCVKQRVLTRFTPPEYCRLCALKKRFTKWGGGLWHPRTSLLATPLRVIDNMGFTLVALGVP